MHFRLLGPIQAFVGDTPLNLGKPQQRAVLATLLLRPGYLVTVPQLLTAVWDEAPPPSAVKNLQGHVYRLRRALAPIPLARLRTRDRGYQLDVDPDQVDLHRFRRLLTAAHGADDPVAADLLAQALSLWRGPPLAGLASSTLRATADQMDEERLAAQEHQLEIKLRLGRHVEVISELRSLVHAHPLREHARVLLMLALFRAGRQAEALATYRVGRDMLMADLGLEPGAELSETHRKVLLGDPQLVELPGAGPPAVPQPHRVITKSPPSAGAESTGRQGGAARLAATPHARPATVTPPGHTGAPVDTPRPPVRDAQAPDLAAEHGRRSSYAIPDQPAADHGTDDIASLLPPARQLPADVHDFVGRQADLDGVLDEIAARAGACRGARISVTGPAGIGKTTFAIRVAHHIAEMYPDGHLYADLRGTSATPHDPARALDGFVRTLAGPMARLPVDVDQLAALYRSLLARGRYLIILDDALDESQVRPLLPGEGRSTVVITGRRLLPSLDDTHLVVLAPLPTAEAIQLLAATVGSRAREERDATEELAALCAGLPLALRVAGTRLVSRPAWSVADLVSRLRDEDRRLEEFTSGDRTVLNVFALSYNTLPSPAQLTFRRIGLFPGPSLTVVAAAALTSLSIHDVTQTLELLVDASLLQNTATGRYTMHELLRLYARRRVQEDDGSRIRTSCMARLFARYVDAMEAAGRMAYPERGALPDTRSARRARHPIFDSDAAARAWIEDERPNVLPVMDAAARAAAPRTVWRLANALFGYFYVHGHINEWINVARTGLAAASDAAHRNAIAAMHHSLATAYRQAAAYPTALRHFRKSLHATDTDDQDRATVVLGGMAAAYAASGALWRSERAYRQSLSLSQSTGNRIHQAHALGGLGLVYAQLGDLQAALDHHRQALCLYEDLGDHYGRAASLCNMGNVHRQRREHDLAHQYLDDALGQLEKLGSRYGQAVTLNYLAELDRDQGRLNAAHTKAADALTIAHSIGEIRSQVDATNTLASIAMADGRPEECIEQHEFALKLARQIQHRYGMAMALSGLAKAHQKVGQPATAAQHKQQAQRMCRRLRYRAVEVQLDVDTAFVS